jgi:competence protein ComGC
MDLIQEMFEYFKFRKKYWLVPIMIFIFVISALMIVTQGTAVAPFIYTLF